MLVFRWLKPLLSAGLLIGFLLVTGLFDEAQYYAQSAVMKTGILAASTEAPEGPPPAFDFRFTLQDLQGNPREAAEFKGKVVFVNLWATW